MRTLLIIAGTIILVAVAIMVWPKSSPILAQDIQAHLVNGSDNSVMVTMTLRNPGGPDRLIEVTSDVARLALLKAPDTGGLPIPAESEPSLAMEAGHIMLMGLTAPAPEGTLVPMTLHLASGASLPVKARVSAPAMSHDQFYDVPGDESQPSVSIEVKPDGDAWAVVLTTRNFRFARDLVDRPHQPGTGHGHLYVQGIKIGRIYETNARIGALPAGTHEVHVTLNTNDHRLLRTNGTPVEARVRITVP